jgi:uncharacterized protein YegP (UPF0339 family)
VNDPAGDGQIEFYSRKPLFGRRQYYWRARAANGKIVASGEGYNNRLERDKGMYAARNALNNGDVQVVP